MDSGLRVLNSFVLDYKKALTDFESRSFVSNMNSVLTEGSTWDLKVASAYADGSIYSQYIAKGTENLNAMRAMDYSYLNKFFSTIYASESLADKNITIALQDVNEIAHILWVRKAVRNTRALVLTAGSQPTFGIQSLIRDPEVLRQRYGFEVIKLPFTSIFKYMDEITDEAAKPIADKLIAGSTDTQVNTDWFINDIKYYLAAKKMMDIYDCNAFSTACHELCTTEIPQNRKFTPCMCHSIMKDEGIPSGCEEDLNALMAMLIMQYAANRPAFMGNPNHETDELLRIHHAVPALCMNGYGTKPLEYKLWAFTGQGFGGKLQVDFTQNEDDYITLGRFNPAGDTMCIKKGKVIRSEYAETYCSPYYYIQMDDAREFMHNLAGFGHHQVLIFGDYPRLIKKIAKVMDFNILEG